MVLSSVSKNWLLGWYNDKAIAIGLGESWRGRLVAFVDYEVTGPRNNEVVLVRLGTFLFVQYNKPKYFNTYIVQGCSCDRAGRANVVLIGSPCRPGSS